MIDKTGKHIVSHLGVPERGDRRVIMWKGENVKELESGGTTSFGLKGPVERVRVDRRSKPIHSYTIWLPHNANF